MSQMSLSKNFIIVVLFISWTHISYAQNILTVDELVLNEDVHHGKLIVVKGRLNLEFEGHSLYGDKHRVWLHMFVEPYTEESVNRDWARIEEYKKALQDKIVILRGVFNKDNTGHFGLYPAGFDYVEEIKAFENGS